MIDWQNPDAVLLRRIKRFLVSSDMKPTRFGREAIGDSRLITDMSNRGRTLRQATRDRVEAFLISKGG